VVLLSQGEERVQILRVRVEPEVILPNIIPQGGGQEDQRENTSGWVAGREVREFCDGVL